MKSRNVRSFKHKRSVLRELIGTCVSRALQCISSFFLPHPPPPPPPPIGSVVEVEKETKTSTDPKAEIRKLFSDLQSTATSSSSHTQPGTAVAKPRTWRDLTRGLPAGNPGREAIMAALKELEVWSVLHQFCTSLPVLQSLDRDKSFLSSCVADAGSPHSLETLVERYTL